MTGESLVNGTYDVIGQRFAQSGAKAVDSVLVSGNLAILAGIAIFIITVYLFRIAKKG